MSDFTFFLSIVVGLTDRFYLLLRIFFCNQSMLRFLKNSATKPTEPAKQEPVSKLSKELENVTFEEEDPRAAKKKKPSPESKKPHDSKETKQKASASSSHRGDQEDELDEPEETTKTAKKRKSEEPEDDPPAKKKQKKETDADAEDAKSENKRSTNTKKKKQSEDGADDAKQKKKDEKNKQESDNEEEDAPRKKAPAKKTQEDKPKPKKKTVVSTDENDDGGDDDKKKKKDGNESKEKPKKLSAVKKKQESDNEEEEEEDAKPKEKLPVKKTEKKNQDVKPKKIQDKNKQEDASTGTKKKKPVEQQEETKKSKPAKPNEKVEDEEDVQVVVGKQKKKASSTQESKVENDQDSSKQSKKKAAQSEKTETTDVEEKRINADTTTTSKLKNKDTAENKTSSKNTTGSSQPDTPKKLDDSSVEPKRKVPSREKATSSSSSNSVNTLVYSTGNKSKTMTEKERTEARDRLLKILPSFYQDPGNTRTVDGVFYITLNGSTVHTRLPNQAALSTMAEAKSLIVNNRYPDGETLKESAYYLTLAKVRRDKNSNMCFVEDESSAETEVYPPPEGYLRILGIGKYPFLGIHCREDEPGIFPDINLNDIKYDQSQPELDGMHVYVEHSSTAGDCTRSYFVSETDLTSLLFYTFARQHSSKKKDDQQTTGTWLPRVPVWMPVAVKNAQLSMTRYYMRPELPSDLDAVFADFQIKHAPLRGCFIEDDAKTVKEYLAKHKDRAHLIKGWSDLRGFVRHYASDDCKIAYQVDLLSHQDPANVLKYTNPIVNDEKHLSLLPGSIYISTHFVGGPRLVSFQPVPLGKGAFVPPTVEAMTEYVSSQKSTHELAVKYPATIGWVVFNNVFYPVKKSDLSLVFLESIKHSTAINQPTTPILSTTPWTLVQERVQPTKDFSVSSVYYLQPQIASNSSVASTSSSSSRPSSSSSSSDAANLPMSVEL